MPTCSGPRPTTMAAADAIDPAELAALDAIVGFVRGCEVELAERRLIDGARADAARFRKEHPAADDDDAG
jgi:hypothetical protein